MDHVAATNITNRGSICDTMNCAPSTPTTNPITVFASPPMPTMPPASESCARPAAAPGEQSRHRTERQRDVNDRHEHQVDRDPPADQQAARIV